MFGFAGIFLLEGRKLRKGGLLILLMAALLLACSCGGGASPAASSSSTQALPQGTFAVTVSGTSSLAQSSTLVTLNLQ